MDVSNTYLIRLLLILNVVAVVIVIGVAFDKYINRSKPTYGNKNLRVPNYSAPAPTLNIEGDTRVSVPGGFGAPNYLYRMKEVFLG